MCDNNTLKLYSDDVVQMASAKKHIKAFSIRNVIPTDGETFRAAVDAAKEKGFAAIRLHLAWYNIERLPLRYDFRLYDAQVAYIRRVGMRVILQIDLQRRSHVLDGVRIPCDLVLNTDEFAYCPNETEAAYSLDEGVETVMLSYASRKGTDYAVRFYRDTVKHFSDRFGDTVFCIYPTLSPDGTTDYPEMRAPDASAHMRRAFAAYLSDTYRKVKELNRDLDADHADFDSVPLPTDMDNDLRCVLFYQARHTVLDNLIDRLREAHKSVTEKIPFAYLPGAERGEQQLHEALMEVIGAHSVEGKKVPKVKAPEDPASPAVIFRRKAKAAAMATGGVASAILLLMTAVAAKIITSDEK